MNNKLITDHLHTLRTDRPIRPGNRHRTQVHHRPRLRRRVRPRPDPWSACHDVADVDGVWYHAGVCCRFDIFERGR